VETPCGVAVGPVAEGKLKICLVSVVRSGDILQEAVRQLEPGVAVGKILIQRDESTEDKRPVLYYKKFPKDLTERFIILVDPMLATAGKTYKDRSYSCQLVCDDA
jgi:uracil phosphoribosyltransferase